jgi:ribosomal protein L24
MIKTKICKGDKVHIIKGEGSNLVDPETKKPQLCTVLKVDRIKGRLLLDVPKGKKRGEKQTPVRGVEQWKTARYNSKTGEAGGLKIMKRPIHISNVQVVEKGPRHEKTQSI